MAHVGKVCLKRDQLRGHTVYILLPPRPNKENIFFKKCYRIVLQTYDSAYYPTVEIILVLQELSRLDLNFCEYILPFHSKLDNYNFCLQKILNLQKGLMELPEIVPWG